MFDGMHGGAAWGMHWLWWVFWIVIILLAVWGVTTRASRSRSSPRHETPLQVLERRYANGEITTEEYRERKAELEGGRP